MSRRENQRQLLIIAAIVGVGFLLSRKAVAAPAPGAPATLPYDWRSAVEDAFVQAEQKYGIPPGVLKSMAGVESGFREDVVFCRTTGGAGEQGIMQITPRWHPTANACNPTAAIDYAASYLRKLYNRFGNWRMAVVAYNWGPTNLANKGYEQMPQVTWNYINRVARETGI